MGDGDTSFKQILARGKNQKPLTHLGNNLRLRDR